MTLNQFITEHKLKLKSAKKLNVRDLDELTKNNFVAYVDDGGKSYDVQLVLDSKKNVKSTSCDCDFGGICSHIIALVAFVSESKNEKPILKKAAKKKLSETDEILETINEETLKIWLSETLNRNKELAFIFKNHFGRNEFIVDENSIKKTIQESITSIIGKRKKIETSEVKKIVDNLNVSLKPILDSIFLKFTPENHNLFKIVVNVLEEFNYTHYITSTRITKLVENLYNAKLKSLFNIKEIEEWQKAVRFYINLIFEDKFYKSDLDFVANAYELSKTNEFQKNFLVKYIEEKYNVLYENFKENFSLLSFEIDSLLLTIFIENGLFKKYLNNFKPRKFQNTYNLLLTQELVNIKQSELAEKYCLEQIAGNLKTDYDLPYVTILIDIYTQNNDTIKLADILCDYGKYIFSISHYNFIRENATTEKFKKYRQAVLTNARYSYQGGNIEAFDFYFEIKKIDGKQNDLFEMLANSHNLAFVNQYKGIAHQLDEIKFLQTVIQTSYYYNKNEGTTKEIIDFILTKTDSSTLKFYLKNSSSYYHNYIHNELINAIVI
ncbi:MAG: SWIM zinc finger family protein [Limnohabitans sp.]|nr:SWIM zinc finger family protein [Limnohabitans sp.]